MVQSRTQVYFLPADGSVTRAFRSGVSLHSHTEHSKERLGDLPRYLERMPVVAQFLQWERKRYHAKTGRAMDFSCKLTQGPATVSEPLRAIRGSSGSRPPETTSWADTGSALARLGVFQWFLKAIRNLSSSWWFG